MRTGNACWVETGGCFRGQEKKSLVAGIGEVTA